MSLSSLDPQWLEEIEAAVEYVSIIDADDNLLYVNHAAEAADELRGLSVYDFVEPAYHDTLRHAVNLARQTGRPQHYTSYAMNMQGERSEYSNWVFGINAADIPEAIAFIATDVTQLSRVAEELELSDSTLRSLIESSPDTIFIVDRQRVILYASRLEYGFDSSAVIGLVADQFIPEADLPMALAVFENAMSASEPVRLELPVETPTGTRHFVARLAPIKNHEQIDRMMIVVTDVTEQHESEAKQKRLQQQLQQAQKMESIGQLTGGVAHDFNNVLLTIGGNLELAQASLDDPTAAEGFLRDALAGIERGRDLNQRLLAFSRRQPLLPEPLDIGELVENMDSMLRRTLGENIRVSTDTTASEGHVSKIDRTQLENAILNLALNARDAMSSGGELNVTTRWIPGDEMQGGNAPLGLNRLTIKDKGEGMTPNTLAHATEPFFTTKAVGEGSGLGLSMVYGFVQQSGGDMHIQSELGVGTEVTIDLPCVEDIAGTPDSKTNEHPIPRGNGELILLVEDERSVRELTAKMLEDTGYQVITAFDGDSGFSVVQERTDIDLLITDIVMPGELNGYKLANRCRMLRPKLPIMLVSGHPLERNLIEHTERWASDLLQKPYRTEELARFVASKLADHSPRDLND